MKLYNNYYLINMNKVTIIGGSGFVGSRLIELLNSNIKISNFDKNPSLKFADITTIGDVRNFKEVTNIIKGSNTIVLLAAEHRDDVSPTSLYYDVNVLGVKNVVKAMDQENVRNIIFTSSVAVYGLNKNNPDELHPADPFNHYGKSKWEAEEILRAWFNKDSYKKTLTIIRPTVIFGERNRGNVYNLLKQIASGRFIMVGKGENYKSMAYVGNVAAFIKYIIEKSTPGYYVYNYVDKPDVTMNELVKQVEISLAKPIPSIHLPYWMGVIGGYCFDIAHFITKKKYPISSIRVKKFCATTQFSSIKVHYTGFSPPFLLSQGLHNTIYSEFKEKRNDDITFDSE